MPAPRHVIADAMWYYHYAMSAAEKAELIDSINTVWSPELESIWEPSVTIDMNQWLDDYCIVAGWRQHCYDTWHKLCDDDCIYPISVYGISSAQFDTSAKTYPVFVNGFSKFTSNGDIACAMSAIGGDAEIVRFTRPKFPNGQLRSFVVIEYATATARNRALNWSNRISLDDAVLTIAEKK